MVQIRELAEKLCLGKLTGEPSAVAGGLLHKMYRVHTDKGIFAVKVLNREIVKRPDALKNTINSELAAEAFAGEIPVIASLRIDGKQIHELNGTYYMVFPWITGKSVFPGEISGTHCRRMGKILGKLHAKKLFLKEMEAEKAAFPLYEWERYLQMAAQDKEEWVSCYRNAAEDIMRWNENACRAQTYLSENVVISHRDLDPKNVMWDGGAPFVIDWEAAGYVNPYQELLEVINYWADDGNGGLVKKYFEALVGAYSRCMPLDGVEWDKVFDGSYIGMLGWLEYNVKRALGLEASDEEEMQLGREQVKGTVAALYDYAAKAELLKEWFETHDR